MPREMTVDQFAEEFRQQIISNAELEGEEGFREDIFTQLMLEYLDEAGEIDEGIVCSHRASGIQVNGYGVSEDEECLYVMISILKMEVPPPTVGKSEIETGFKRATTFIKKAFNGLYLSLEEASSIFDFALRVYELKDSLTKIRIYLLSDGKAKLTKTSDSEIGGIPVSYQIWDIERLFRWWSSGKCRETIEIDFQEEFEQIIPCLPMPEENEDYVTYLAIFPGKTLVDLYSEYGSRLLERNVRSFLQVRGNVNKGIRNTILNEPHMFLAYNNGISATAEKVEMTSSENGTRGMKWIRDLQIVNGGQTTASIYHAAKKDKADLSRIFVQVKLTVLVDTTKMDEIVPRISQYANNQNKVQTADFSANDPFHRKIEELSRTIWAPAANGGQRQTRWFYERARGQYMDQKNREATPARRKAFEATHPSSQQFTKTDLAKFENTWDQYPHLVSRGAQKNFQEFTVRLGDRGGILPDQKYFEHLVAKAILFRKTEKLVQAQRYGGYRANIVAYTLAWLSHKTAKRMNLEKIWDQQGLPPIIEESIITVSRYAHKHIINPPGGGNITEWCKKDKCWISFMESDIKLSSELETELVEYGRRNADQNRGVEAPDIQDMEVINRIMQISPETWFAISSWSKETNNLKVWQRSIAFSLGRLAAQGRQPSRKQAAQGVIILEEAKRMGFNIGDAEKILA